MTSRLSRGALIAGLAIGAGGLVAVPAEAASISAGFSTANYYVNQPAVTGATSLTPESAVLTGAVDTGGNPGSALPVGGGLTWDAGISIMAGAKWAGDTTGATVPVDGLPANGSNDPVSVQINDATLSTSGAFQFISNAGNGNFSNVGFDYDPVADYVANGNSPGIKTQYAPEVDVPTTTGISAVRVSVGAFGQTAQDNSGQSPLTPGTKYYYWIVQEPGETHDAQDVNIAGWFDGSGSSPQPTGSAVDANPTIKCIPDAVIAADPTLASYNSSTQITADGTTAPALQGPCNYYYGNVSGAIYYTSPNGEFTTPKLGTIAFGAHAAVAGHKATVKVTDRSGYRAAGTVALMVGKKKVATGKFELAAHATGSLSLSLTSAGMAAARQHRTAKVVLSSTWDQPAASKSVKF